MTISWKEPSKEKVAGFRVKPGMTDRKSNELITTLPHYYKKSQTSALLPGSVKNPHIRHLKVTGRHAVNE
jgi:hypothetical protein